MFQSKTCKDYRLLTDGQRSNGQYSTLCTDLLTPYIHGPGMRVLELFARYTASGVAHSNVQEKEGEDESFWFSVGNEPLKYNEVGAHWAME